VREVKGPEVDTQHRELADGLVVVTQRTTIVDISDMRYGISTSILRAHTIYLGSVRSCRRCSQT
jgi:hypothetical protein